METTTDKKNGASATATAAGQETALVKREAAAAVPYTAPYTPQTYEQAIAVAGVFAKATGRPMEQVFLQMAAAAPLGIDPVAALQTIDVIDGPNGRTPSYRARLMVALCLRSPLCEYFECVDSDATHATWRAKRVGRPERVASYGIEDAQRAKLVKSGGAYEKDPESQFNARCSARLARLVFPDVVLNMYTREEIEEAAIEARVVEPDVRPLTAPTPTAVVREEQPREELTEEEEKARAARWERALLDARSDADGKVVRDEIAKAYPDKEHPIRRTLANLLSERKKAKWAAPEAPEPPHNPVTGEVAGERQPGEDDE